MVTTNSKPFNRSESEYLSAELIHQKLENVYSADQSLHRERLGTMPLLTMKYNIAFMMKELEQVYQLLNRLEMDRATTVPSYRNSREQCKKIRERKNSGKSQD